jgi:hypothetical protein
MIFVEANIFPNVPNLPGVPQLARAALGLLTYLPAPTLGTQAPLQALFHATLAAPVWGVYDSEGNQAIEHDSMRSFDYRAEWAVADFPVQDGGFGSYDKVTRSFDASVTLVKGGSASDRTNFLNDCQTVAGSLNQYQIFTPEKRYLAVNCTRMELSRRETNRAFFLEVELFFREIREVTAQYSSTAAATQNASVPSAEPPANQGPKQPATPTPQAAAGAAVAVQNAAGM